MSELMDLKDFFPFFIIPAFIGLFLYLAFSKQGKGWLFGGKIIYTSPYQIKKSYLIKTHKVVVHTLIQSQEPHEKMIGLEVSETRLGNYRLVPLSLTTQETLHLIEMLEDALNKKDSH